MRGGTSGVVLEGVIKRYPAVTALDGVDLELAGEGIVGLVGVNGAGKTTLLSVLCGFARPSKGSVRIFGKPPSRAYRRLGYMPEQPYYHRLISARRLLRTMAAMRRIPLRQRGARCREALELVGLGQAASRPLSQMSKGMLQRFGVAQAIVADPDVLVMDEPMSGLDPVGQKDFRDIIAGMRRPGRIVLISSHMLYHVERMCDTVVFMDAGRILYQGPPSGDPTVPRAVTIRLTRPITTDQAAWLEQAGARLRDTVEIEIPGADKRAANRVLSYLIEQDLQIDRLDRSTTLEQLFLEVVGR